MPAVLNLSNEVVKMRAQVRRVKVLIIRKLTRQIMALRKKKGTEVDVEKNQRRAERLLKEIHELKTLPPDSVTKAALQSDINFEKVCQNKDSSLSERATARIASHPEFSKRIQNIKNAVEAFKAERISAERMEKKKKEKTSRDVDQQETESEVDSGKEDDSGDEEDEVEDDDGDSCSQKVQKADEEKLKEPMIQNQHHVTSQESSSETDSNPAEVVRMRKEVKKLRVLIIRNLTQQITSLKKSKAEESELKGNTERVARLQKEVQVLRPLLPDHITIRVLKGTIDLEKVFQDPESSAMDRVMARIATHPRFVKKLQDVRQGLEEGKIKAAKAELEKDVSEIMKAEDSEGDEVEVESEDIVDSDDVEKANEEEEKEKAVEKVKETTRHPTMKVIPRSNVGKPPEDTRLGSANEKSKDVELKKAVSRPAKLKTISKTGVQAVQSLPSKHKEPAPLLRQASKPDPKKPENQKDKEESDLSDSEEEKEYFDDSTEERFRKASSYSEQSDDDDFFLGKVSKLKKKKKSDTATRTEKTSDPNKSAEKEASETPLVKMQSVFCSTLSKSSGSSQKDRHSGPKPPRFQHQKCSQSDEKPSWVKSQGSGWGKGPSRLKNQTPGPRVSSKQKGPRGDNSGKFAFEQKHPTGKTSQHALHPSWEASRKRKEQQAQITAFQGKKIKFDYDDD